jgi:hypothetical protein
MPSREGALRSIAVLLAWLIAAPTLADTPPPAPSTRTPPTCDSLDRGMAVETTRQVAPGTWSGGLVLDHAEGPLALRLAGKREQLPS